MACSAKDIVIKNPFMYCCAGNIEEQYHKMLSELQQKLSVLFAVCTTADIWTCHNRSFFGVTVHWIESNTLERKSAALACFRLRGRHTFDLIAGTLENIHSTHRVTDKVVCTVTDNGSNFVKAFKEFSEPEAAPSDTTQTVLAQAADGEVTFTNIGDILVDRAGAEETQYILPPHHRCGAHTMNLIAVTDSELANNDANFKKNCIGAQWQNARLCGTRAAEVHRQLRLCRNSQRSHLPYLMRLDGIPSVLLLERYIQLW